ncbi:serine/threonine-protein kinase prk-2-like isoform X2 [Bolinopsis microptera]|uniref:serine/threonine-protein kinase prk-2-like isoform X2 n=1 Tax=Bolinopsis microptera TaxID=2820187 RepID=UPI0030795584
MSETKMLETVAQYLSSNCFSWRADKIRKQLPRGPAENTFYHKYYVVRKLGSGGYGTVFLVARRADNKRFAAKIVPQARCRRTTWCTARQMWVPDEVTIWEALQPHDNIVQLVESYLERGHWILVTEYLTGYLDLFDYNIAIKKLPLTEVRAILRQVIRTCQNLIELGVDHRDIKDENLLYNPETQHVKLLDFGSASRITPEQTYNHIQGTDIYIPYEFYSSSCYTPDGGTVWSIGCLAYILLNRRPPFVNREHVKTHDTINWLNPDDGGLKEFVEKCLVKDPEQRWKLDEIAEFEWLHVD